MGYAIKNDNTGFRAVDSANDISIGEYYADNVPDIYYQTIENILHDTKIKTQISELEALTLRPLRAIANNTATSFDRQRLQDIDAQIEALRLQIRIK